MATSMPTSPRVPVIRRPFGVTLVTILTWAAAIADVVAGITFMSEAEDHALRHDLGMTETELRWYGGALIVLGIVTALVAIGLGRGARWARGLVTVVMALRVAGAVYALTQISWENQRNESLSAIGEIVVSGLILWILYSNRADAWFGRER
jgi:hypothetical protein